jgi:molybdopterin synthase catalytic subunit
MTDSADRASRVYARVTADPLDPATVEEFVTTASDGAVVVFRGVVRDHDPGASGAVVLLEYEAHPDAERLLREVVTRVAESSGLAVAAEHRVGSLAVGDLALVAAVAAPHRADAFAACARLVDELKASVPIWKRQHAADGTTEWVGL